MPLSKEPTAVEFCSGAGGTHLGLLAAGVRVALANDFSALKAATYKRNFPGTRFDHRSITRLRGWAIPAIGIATIGAPCPSFSVAGKGEELGDERGMVLFQLGRLLDEMKAADRLPAVVCIENVPNILDGGGDDPSVLVCTALHSAGYAPGIVVMNALDHVAQSRERVFFVGVRLDVAVPPHLVGKRPVRKWHDNKVREVVKRLSPAVRAAWRWWRMPAPAPRTVSLADIVERDVPPSAWCSPEQHAEAARLMHPDAWAAIRAAWEEGGDDSVGILMKGMRVVDGEKRRVRLARFDGYARTLVRGDGHSGQRLLFPRDGGRSFAIRTFTPRELARLSGFPDSYELPATVTAVRELMGDAVVPAVYRHLAEHLLVPLSRAPLGPIRPRPLPRRTRERTRVPNRSMKRDCIPVTIYLTPDSHERVSRSAQAGGRTLQEEFLQPYDRELAAKGDIPLRRYASKPRRGPGGGPPGGGRRPGRAGRTAPPAQRRGAPARARLAEAATPVRHPGGKARVASRLVALLGATTCLVEPFAGGAAVAVRAVLTGMAGRAVLAERDEGLRTMWGLVAAAPDGEFDEFLREVGAAQPSRAWWDAFVRRASEDPRPSLVAARRLLEGRFLWGGMPTGGVRSDAELRDALRVGTMVERLRAIRDQRGRLAVRDDAMDAIREFARDPLAKFFVDPPYSVAGTGPGTRLYRHHEVDHDALLAALSEVRGAVAVTYDDRPEVRALAAKHGFAVGHLPIQDARSRHRRELLLTRGVGPP